MSVDQKEVDRLKELCLTESQTLWAQGDLLVENNWTDDELKKVAEQVQRAVGTLRMREKVAREFPSERRDSRHAFSVYAQLVRIPGADARQALLDSRSEWTVESMTREVTRYQERELQASRSGVPNKAKKSGMRVGEIQVKGEYQDGQLTITVEGVPVDPKIVTLQNRSMVIYEGV